MRPSDASPRATPATIYLASADDAQAGRLPVAGRPVAFRALMSALRAGCASVAVPAVFRGTEVERAIERSARARAGAVWLPPGDGDADGERRILLPSTVVLSAGALRALLEAQPVAVLSAAPATAPVVLADRSILAALDGPMAAGRPVGDALCRALPPGRPAVANGGWCVRATSGDARALAERRLYAELGSAVDTRLDRVLHRRVSRYLTRAAVTLGVPPNAITLASLALGLVAVACFVTGTVGGALAGVLLYFAAAVLDHVDGEVARLTYAESRLGEWLDVAVDTAVHATTALALGVVTGRVAGTGLTLGVVTAAGFAMSALAAKWSGRGERVPRVMTRLGNRDGFYVLLVAYLALLALAPALLPALLLLAAVGSHAYWLGHVALRLRRRPRAGDVTR